MSRFCGLIIFFGLAFGIALSGSLLAQRKPLALDYYSDDGRIIRTDEGEEYHVWGDVHFFIDSTTIVADSAVWFKSSDIVKFFRNVEIFDSVEHLWAGYVEYFVRDSLAIAEHNVRMVNLVDSIQTESERAEYDRRGNLIFLSGSPVLYLNYPDVKNMVRIYSEYMFFTVNESRGEAVNNVLIEHHDTSARCQCAEFFVDGNLLSLDGQPHAVRGDSDIDGQSMNILFADRGIQRIDVFDKAKAVLVEEADSLTGEFAGQSNLNANKISFYFKDDEIRKIAAVGEASSEYYPAEDDTTGAGTNLVSGDSIFIYISNQRSQKVDIIGGAEGVYITDRKAHKESDSTGTAETNSTDTPTLNNPAAPDSALTGIPESVQDSLAIDSMAKEPMLVQDSIHYRGQFLEFFVEPRIIRITGNSRVRQENANLTANRIDYDINKRVLVAEARFDTIADDSVIIYPLTLQDGGEEISGTHLVFNIDTKKGKIDEATTKFDQAWYRGKDLYKEEEKIYYVKDGILIPCELETANVYFRSKRMKVIQDNKAIAKPVVLYIEDIPVMAIPYYVFPLKRGRHSGILPIRLGNFERGNRYIGNIGYYWAASEYWDIQTAYDYYENSGWVIDSKLNYNKRYAFSGYISGSYGRDTKESVAGISKGVRWSFTGSHTQTLPYDVDFRASGSFVSDKDYYTDYSTNQNDRLNRSMTAKANLNKKWSFGSLSLSFNHTNNLDSDSKYSSLPSGTFNVVSFQPFGDGKEVDGKLEKRWYNYLRVKYSNDFAVYTSSSRIDDSTVNRKEYAYLDHAMSLSSTQTLFKYFNLTISTNGYETWYYLFPTNMTDELNLEAHKGYRRAAVSAGLNLNTNLYGTFPVGLFGFQTLRQVLTPGIGFSWAPTVTKNDPIKSYVGQGAGGSKSKTMSMSLTQLYQAKIKSGEQVKNIDLFRISSGTSYNFEGGVRKFFSLSSTISSSLIKNLNLNGSMTHDLYDENDKLIWWRPRLSAFSISTTFNARGSVSEDFTEQPLDQGSVIDSLHNEEMNTSGLNHEITDPANNLGTTSWNLAVSYYYAENGLTTDYASRTHWIKFTFDIGLTANWKIRYEQNYDFVDEQSTEKVIDIVRTLPCWQGHFYWIPTGSRQGYYFKINLISIPDIKFEKSESGLRGALLNY